MPGRGRENERPMERRSDDFWVCFWGVIGLAQGGGYGVSLGGGGRGLKTRNFGLLGRVCAVDLMFEFIFPLGLRQPDLPTTTPPSPN